MITPAGARKCWTRPTRHPGWLLAAAVGQGHWNSQGYWVDPQGHLFAFDPTTLPDLHC